MSQRISSEQKSLKQASTTDRPGLPKWLFWDFKYEEINWQFAYRTVIGRVIDRGDDQQWDELVRFYGLDKVKHTIQFDTVFLSDSSIARVCKYFNVKPEELRCYIRKRSRKGRWH